MPKMTVVKSHSEKCRSDDPIEHYAMLGNEVVDNAAWLAEPWIAANPRNQRYVIQKQKSMREMWSNIYESAYVIGSSHANKKPIIDQPIEAIPPIPDHAQNTPIMTLDPQR